MNIYKLIPGIEKPDHIDLLFQHTKIESEAIKNAVRDVLVRGARPSYAAHKYQTSERQVFRAIATLQKHHTINEKINELKGIKPFIFGLSQEDITAMLLHFYPTAESRAILIQELNQPQTIPDWLYGLSERTARCIIEHTTYDTFPKLFDAYCHEAKHHFTRLPNFGKKCYKELGEWLIPL